MHLKKVKVSYNSRTVARIFDVDFIFIIFEICAYTTGKCRL